MRKFILGIAGAAALGLAALSPSGASAQSFSITIGTGHAPGYHYAPAYGYAPPPFYHAHRPRYGSPRYDRPPYYGASRYKRPRFADRCIERSHRYWNGRAWVTERRRTCR